MKSIYDIETLAEVLDRLGQIKPDSPALWGKMNAAQMMEHCARTLDYATGKTREPRLFLGYLLGGLFKSQYYNDKPWSRNAPTSNTFAVTSETNFAQAKARLEKMAKQFSTGGPSKCTHHPSPFFGKLTPEQHGLGQYKHLDHHLQQFGV